MVTRKRLIGAPPSAVWDVLADGWSYPVFVVGASSMRSVDAGWPAPGSVLHHSVGAWPVLLNDTSSVRSSAAPHRLELVARGWPAGEAVVLIEVEAAEGGSLVTMTEEPSRGPGVLVPPLVRELVLGPRNTETLKRLERLVLGRWSAPPPGSSQP